MSGGGHSFYYNQLGKIEQSGEFLGRLLGPLLKNGLPLIKNVLKPLAKSVLISLGLTAAAAATDTDIKEKNFKSGMTTFITLKEEMNDITKMIKSLENAGLLNIAKEQKGGFLGM